MNTHYFGSFDEMLVLDTWIKLSRAGQSVVKAIRPSLEQHELTLAQFGVLEMLLHLGPLNQKLIGKKLLRSAGNVVKVVDNLERDGLVNRKTSAIDRRSREVQLTATGKRLITTVFAHHLQELMTFFSTLNTAEKRALGCICRKLGLGQTE